MNSAGSVAGIRRRLPTLLAFVILAGAGCRPAGDGGTERPGAEERALVAFEPAVVNLGVIVPGSRVDTTVRIRNVAYRDARIVGLEAPCDCTTATLRLPVSLAAGTAMELPLTLDLAVLGDGGLPRGSTGPHALVRHVVARTDGGVDAVLEVRATVTDQVLVEPPLVDFGQVLVGEVVVGEVRVLPGRGRSQPVRVLGMLPGDPLLRAFPPSSEGVVAVTWGPLDEPGDAQASVELLTDVAGIERARLRVRARVVELLRVQPRRIVVLEARTTRPVVVRVALSRRDGQPLQVLGTSAGNPNVEHRVLPAGPDPSSRQVEVVVPVLPPPGRIEDRLVIRTDAPGGERVEIPIHVAAADPVAGGVAGE